MAGDLKKGRYLCSRCQSAYNDPTVRFCTDCGGRLLPADPSVGILPTGGGTFAKLLGREIRDEQVLPPRRPDVETESDRIQDVPPAPVVEATASSAEDVSVASVSQPAAIASEPVETSTPLSEPFKGADASTESTSDPGQSPEADGASVGSVASGTLLGTMLGDRFIIRDLIAIDTRCSIYQGEDLRSGAKVLVKVYPNEDFDAAPLRGQFESALRRLSRFEDADFASVLAAGRIPDGRLILVSEYVEGNSLAQVLVVTGPFEKGRAAMLVRRLSDSLAEAHAKGIFHGGLASENIVLLRPDDPKDEFKIIGLGIAYSDVKVLGGASPGLSHDIRDLATVAFHLLTGRDPRPDGKDGSSSPTISDLSVSRLVPGMPESVDSVLAKAFDPTGQGFPGIKEFGDALHTALQGDAAPVPHETTASVAVMTDPVPDEDPDVLSRIQVRAASVQESDSGDPGSRKEPKVFVHGSSGWSGRGKWLRSALLVSAVILVAAVAYVLLIGKRGSEVTKAPAVVSAEQAVRRDEPIQPRNLPVPEGFVEFTNQREGLDSELAKTFIPFKFHRPASWNAVDSKTNFAVMSRRGKDGSLLEHFIVTSYASDGTFEADLQKFPGLVEKSDSVLRSEFPTRDGFRSISQGEILLQDGRLRAYEVKFEYKGTLESKDVTLWGRRLWIPVQKPGSKYGFVVTLLATNSAPEITGVDDVGTKGELRAVLNSFEPLP